MNLRVDDIEDHESFIIVNIPDTKTKIHRRFTITSSKSEGINFLDIYRKYAGLRPGHVGHRRFFLNYRCGKCSVQAVGINTIGKLPSLIAAYLKLPNPSEYTGHCFRRLSATLLADMGADITNLKRHGGWKSTSVAESYIEDSIENKIKIANQILGGEQQKSFSIKTEAGPSGLNRQDVDQVENNRVGIESKRADVQETKCVQVTNCSNCVINIYKN